MLIIISLWKHTHSLQTEPVVGLTMPKGKLIWTPMYVVVDVQPIETILKRLTWGPSDGDELAVIVWLPGMLMIVRIPE